MIVLDTHAWIWYIDSPEMLSEKALKAIAKSKASGQVFISCISSWEIYMLEKKKRLSFVVDSNIWISRCEQLSFFNFVPIDNDIAQLAVQLPEPLHPDPADRMIIATAKYLGVPLITKDDKIIKYKHLKTIW